MLHRRLSAYLVIIAFLLATSLPADAEQECDSDDANCKLIGEWHFGLALGIGARTNPLIDSEDIPLLVLPSFSYYGENFFIDNLDVGYTLFDSANHMINLVATPSYDRVFFERWDISNIFVDISGAASPSVGGENNIGDNFTQINANELNKRKFSLLGGAEWSSQLSLGQIQLGIFHDISNVHSGAEARFAYSTLTSDAGWNGTFGLTWKDAEMTDYYYGVDQNEVIDNRALYQAGSSLNPFIRINWQQTEQQSGFWRFGLEFQKLDKSISDSPLINKDYVLNIFIGKQYSF